MARFYDTLRIYSDDTKTTLLGTYDVGQPNVSITYIASDAGISIPQDANGFYYEGTIYGLNDPINFPLGMGTYDCYFTYPESQAETITGFYLDGTEYKFEGGGASYTAGTGIDITNDEIGLDGTYEGNGGKDYSAMRGPCPAGFHVPSKDEFEKLVANMLSLGVIKKSGQNYSEIDNLISYLKLPQGGFLSSTGILTTAQPFVGGVGGYATCTAFNKDSLYILFLQGSYFRIDASAYYCAGTAIRAFKDESVTPDSNWTILYQGTGNAGIYHNTSLGLISISSNGQNRITIADKNVGATVVYNSGDAYTEDNCGKFFQRGNNYGFPRASATTTSSTQVDASSYGPGNYYNSNTFITRSASPYNWSNVKNDNLRGGETGVQPFKISGNLVVGDKLYKIVKSTTAPASGTSSNIITIVTD